MPAYRYAPVASPCRLCASGFDHSSPATAVPLTTCPTCGQPVQRAVAHIITTPKLSAPLSVSSAKQAGFTVLKRISTGEYERQ